MWNTDDEGVSHAEGAVAVGHASIGPALREALWLVQLVGYKPTVPAIRRLHDVFCPGGRSPPPSLVRIVRAGASSGSGNAMAPSEYRYEKPVALLTRGSHLAPLR